MASKKAQKKEVQPTPKRNDRWLIFGQWVKRRRDDLGITQGEAGRRANLSRVHWARIESGDTGTKETTIPGIARALNYNSPEQLAEVYRRARFASDDTPYELPSALKHFSELPPELQQAVVQQIEALYKLHQKTKKT